MASKIAIVIEREYRTRVFKKTFIITTLLMPLLMVAVTTIPALMVIWGEKTDRQVITVVDKTGLYRDALPSTEQFEFRYTEEASVAQPPTDENSEVTGMLEIRQDLSEDPKAITLFSFKTLPKGVEEYINSKLSEHITRQKLLSHQIDSIESIVASSQTTIAANTYKMNEEGETELTSSTLSQILGILLAMMIYFFISMHGGSVLQSVMEEKKSRIMEVMISSVRPFDLMMGKIIGVGLVGLTQVALWGILSVILSQVGLVALSGFVAAGALEDVGMLFNGISFVQITLNFVLYFIGGFLLYASIYAGLGSAISSDEDAQGIVWPVMVLMMVAFYTGLACAESPESTLAQVASYIPFTSPVVMMIRIPYGVATWEMLLSLAVLYASFTLMVFVGARIYRVGVLMYGKKPTLKEIARWAFKS